MSARRCSGSARRRRGLLGRGSVTPPSLERGHEARRSAVIDGYRPPAVADLADRGGQPQRLGLGGGGQPADESGAPALPEFEHPTALVEPVDQHVEAVGQGLPAVPPPVAPARVGEPVGLLTVCHRHPAFVPTSSYICSSVSALAELTSRNDHVTYRPLGRVRDTRPAAAPESPRPHPDPPWRRRRRCPH